MSPVSVQRAVLTDYHLHLRPDDDDRPPGAVGVHGRERGALPGRGRGGGDRGAGRAPSTSTGSPRRSRSGAIRSGSEQARDDLDAYCEFVRTTPLRLGLEVDFVPGAEDRIANLLDGRDFDYVVGSIHFLGDRAVDHDGYDIWEADGDADAVWRRYFETLAEAARSGLFDILAHPDLVKMWGRAGRCRSAIRASTTSPRWRRSPSPESRSRSRPRACESRWGRSTRRRRFAAMCVEAGAVFALSSDAHVPERRRLRLRAGGRGDARLGDRARSPCSSAASAGWSRSDEPVDGGVDDERPGRDRLRRPPLRRGTPAGARRRRDPARASAWRATPTRTCSPTP